MTAEQHRGHRQGRPVMPVQSPGIEVRPEENTGRGQSDFGSGSMRVGCSVPAETNTGGGHVICEPDMIMNQSDLGLSSDTTQSDMNPMMGRPKRCSKPIDRLVVGNPGGWHFNRAKPKR